MNKRFALGTAAATLISTHSSAQTYTQLGNVPIPDPGMVSWDMQITDNVTIGDLDVGVLIQHTWQGDLVVRITHLDTSTAMTVINRPGGTGQAVGFSTDNFGNFQTSQFFVLDDEAANVYDTPFVTFGINNVTGSWKPDAPPAEGVGNLGVFDGESIQGTWRVTVSSHAPHGPGDLRGLQLQVTPVPGPAVLAFIVVAGLSGQRRRRCA